MTRWDLAAVVLMSAVVWEGGQLAGYWPGPADPRWPHLGVFAITAVILAMASRLLRHLP